MRSEEGIKDINTFKEKTRREIVRELLWAS